MRQLYLKSMVTISVAFMSALDAIASTIKVDDFRNTNGASGKDITNVMQKQTATLQTTMELIFMVCTVGGVVMAAICMFVLWKASKDPDREKPMSAVVGFFVGGGLTIIGLMVGLFANTLAV